MIKPVLVIIFIVGTSIHALSQKQLIFVYHGQVVARFTEGSNFKFKLKNGQKKEGFIVELKEFSMITSGDTIAFQSIAKMKGLKRKSVTRGVGGLLFFAGFGYVALDQLNGALGYGRPGWDQSDWNGLIIGGIGPAMIFLKPKYQRLKPGTMIRSIDYKSPYYQHPQF